jgi:hypothetical protein
MLVTATFLAPELPNRDASGNEPPERLLVPRRLVQSQGEGHAVWVAGADGEARLQAIQLGRAGTPELVEVVAGLVPTDKLIDGGRKGLEAGDRVTIAADARN